MKFPHDKESIDIPRTAEEVARRALVLSAVITVAYGASTRGILDWLVKEGLQDEISAREKEFLCGRVSEQDRIDLTWRVEALQVLLWCINKVDSLSHISSQCDTELMKPAIVFPPESTAEFVSSSTLRDEEEIYYEYEKSYQAHWAIRDAQIYDKEMPDGVDPGVAYERHYAFNWVLGYMGQAWDEITTDT